ncbi:hypothetical protein [Neorhizobium sp. NCHU2750]|uniref:hypothetical protein n=1 Tax=Neorhizobium sp. NCHU2750 TaxID=1825976 RepID=UPI000E706F5A|nr:hypothetical protein NCHU2750_24710 [Neorhizobium sp. NCHU2750]
MWTFTVVALASGDLKLSSGLPKEWHLAPGPAAGRGLMRSVADRARLAWIAIMACGSKDLRRAREIEKVK